MLTQVEIEEWKKDETTRKVIDLFSEEIGRLVGHVSEGGVIGESADETAMLTCRLVGKLEGLKFIFQLEVDDEDE